MKRLFILLLTISTSIHSMDFGPHYGSSNSYIKDVCPRLKSSPNSADGKPCNCYNCKSKNGNSGQLCTTMGEVRANCK